MGRSKWDSWRDMDAFRQQMERLFEEARSAQRQEGASGYVWSPLADVLETPQAIIAQVELPGILPEQVVVEVVDGDLVVRGERPFDREEQSQAYLLMERAHGTFARRFPLPPGINGQDISAMLREGLLTITIPKRRFQGPARFVLTIG